MPLWNIPKYTATFTLNRPNTYVALWCLSFVWNLVKHDRSFFFQRSSTMASCCSSSPHWCSWFQITSWLPHIMKYLRFYLYQEQQPPVLKIEILVWSVMWACVHESHYLCYKYDLFDGSLWRKCWNNLSVRDGVKPLFLQHSRMISAKWDNEGRNACLHPFALIF